MNFNTTEADTEHWPHSWSAFQEDRPGSAIEVWEHPLEWHAREAEYGLEMARRDAIVERVKRRSSV